MKNTLIVLAILSLVSACSTKEGKHEGKLILRYNESAGISNLDPIFANRFEDIWAMSQLFNGLVRMNDDMSIAGDLAKNWSLNHNKTVYTFNLRTDVYFHESKAIEGGKRKVLAQDVINSFQRVLDPGNGSQGKYIFENIDKLASGNNLGMKALNDSTIKIYLKQPQHSFIKLLTLPYCYVIPLEAVDYYGEEFTRNPVGTGPFQFKVWRPGDKLVFLKNDLYFEKDEDGNRLPYIDAVSISFIKSRATEFQQFKKGKIDFISGLDNAFQNIILTPEGELNPEFKENYYLQKEPWLKTDYLGILVDENEAVNKDGLMLKKTIRRAINYAIDREKLIKYVRNGIGVPANKGFVPDGINDYGRQVRGYTYNPERAKELLFEAGFDGKNDKPKVKLVAADNYKILCEYIQNQLNEQGFDCEIELLMPSMLRQQVNSHNVNFFRKSWTGDFPDPLNFLNLFNSSTFAPDNGPNYTHFSQPMFDTWMERAEGDISDSERKELYRKMDQMIIDEAPIVPLFYDELIKFISKDVENLKTNSMNQMDLKRVKIKRAS